MEKFGDKPEFEINPETGMLISDGQEYMDIPRVREAIREANTIRTKLPPVQEGHVRLWRGNREGELGQNPSFTNSLEGIAMPFWKRYGGRLSYIDVPKEDLEKYEVKSGAAPGVEFLVTEELAKSAIPVDTN